VRKIVLLNNADVLRSTFKVHSCKAVWSNEVVISVLDTYEL